MDQSIAKVFIATPMYGGSCFAPYVKGLLDASATLHSHGYVTIFSAIANESLIPRARNELVRQFLLTDAEYMLFIDADISFNGEDVMKLVTSGKDLICGLYPKKFIDWKRLNTIARQGYTDLQNYAASYVVNCLDPKTYNPLITNPVVEIKHAGTGFMLIKRGVFDALSPFVKQYRTSTFTVDSPLTKEFFATRIEDDTNYFMSEDYYFCDLWRQHGGKVHADLSIKLSHLGTHTFSGDLFLGGANGAASNN
jgi:hypothetical protein